MLSLFINDYDFRAFQWLGGKETACQAGDMGLIPGSGRFSGEGNGNPLQYSCLGKPIDRGETSELQSMG